MKIASNAPIEAKCDFCGETAMYDAPTIHRGSWAHMCEAHFGTQATWNAGSIGTRIRKEAPDKV